MFDRERPSIPPPFEDRVHFATKSLEPAFCPIHLWATSDGVSTNVWFVGVSPNPVCIIDVWRRALAHSKKSRDEHRELFPFLPARPRRNVAVKKRFGHEPLKC